MNTWNHPGLGPGKQETPHPERERKRQALPSPCTALSNMLHLSFQSPLPRSCLPDARFSQASLLPRMLFPF